MMLKRLTKIMAANLMLSLLVAPFISISVFAAPARQQTICAQDYVVQAGDSLSKLAEKQYGDMLAFPLIVEATNAVRIGDDSYATVTDPNLIEVGWKVCLVNSDGRQANTEMVSDSGTVDLAAQVREASAAWDDAFNAGDVEPLIELYSESAVSMPPNLPALEGKAAIEADFQWLFDNFTAHHQTTIVDLEIAGNLAVEQGKYAMTLTPKDGSETISETGKHIVVRKKFGNTWQVVREIWNTND